MIISIANDSDSLAIANLHIESWRCTYRGIFSDIYLDKHIENERITYWKKHFATKSNNQFVLVAKTHNKLLGFVCVYLNADPKWGTAVDTLHVSQLEMGRGIGTHLLHRIARWLVEKDPNRPVYLWTLEKNLYARSFYENLQAKIIEIKLKSYIDGNKISTVRYVWKTPTELLYATEKSIRNHKKCSNSFSKKF